MIVTAERARPLEATDQRYTTSRFLGGPDEWEVIKPTILYIQDSAGYGDAGHSEEYIRNCFLGRDTFAYIARDKGTDDIVGYVYAVPEAAVKGRSTLLNRRTAHIMSIAVDESHRGEGVAFQLMDSLLLGLRGAGYKRLKGEYRTPHHWADNVEQTYHGRVPWLPWRRELTRAYGPQRRLTIRTHSQIPAILSRRSMLQAS